MEEKIANKYEITADGRVIVISTGRVLKPFLAGKGYPALKLWIDKTYQHRYVHRLVADKYCKNHRPNTEVNHKDGNKLNNHADNLEWVTKSENGKHAYRTGLNWSNPLKGSKHGGSKLAESDIEKIHKLRTKGMSLSEVAKLFPVTKATIWKVCSGRSWRHTNV